MLTELCAELRNYFLVSGGVHTGTFTISGGKITPSDFLKENQYFRIVGSVFNDGIYQGNGNVADPTTNTPHDETFVGAVWAMAVPPAVVALADEIKRFNSKVEELGAVDKGYASESFGGYSYTLSSSAPPMLLEMEKNIKRKTKIYRRMNVL